MAQVAQWDNDGKESDNYNTISLPLNHHPVSDDFLLTHKFAWINEGTFQRNKTLAQSSSALSTDVVVWDQTLVEKYYKFGRNYSGGSRISLVAEHLEGQLENQHDVSSSVSDSEKVQQSEMHSGKASQQNLVDKGKKTAYYHGMVCYGIEQLTALSHIPHTDEDFL